MHVAADGGPIRTVVGDSHRHFVGEESSNKTALSNPYEGPTEFALIVESELRAEVLSYRTQAFRLRLMVGGSQREWICDHLRHIRENGVDIVEAIECKPNLSYLDADERLVQAACREIIEGLGWRHRIIYHRDVVGGGERQVNFGAIYSHKTVHVPDAALDRFERLCETSSQTTFHDLRLALHQDRLKGTAMAHSLICQGRVDFDLNRYLFDPSPVRLVPAFSFHQRIWF